MKSYVLSLKNKTTSLISSNCPQLLQYATTDHLNIIFDEFDIWLLAYMIESSRLYSQQGHYFINTLWLESLYLYVTLWSRGQSELVISNLLYAKNKKIVL